MLMRLRKSARIALHEAFCSWRVNHGFELQQAWVLRSRWLEQQR